MTPFAPYLAAAKLLFGNGWIAVACIGIVAGVYFLGRHHGYEAAEDDRKDAVIEAQGDEITGLHDAIKDATKGAQELAAATNGVRGAAAAARKEIANVLPPRDQDRDCDLPAAARSVQNRSSGYSE